MIFFFLRRLALFPLTLFATIAVNFIIINLAPGDPSTYIDLDPFQEMRSIKKNEKEVQEDPQRLFRLQYGLNLPVFFNGWLFESASFVQERVKEISLTPQGKFLLEERERREKKRLLYDKAPFQMSSLLAILQDETLPFRVRQTASMIMRKGAYRLGSSSLFLSAADRRSNREIAYENEQIKGWVLEGDPSDELRLREWVTLFYRRGDLTRFQGVTFLERVVFAFQETRFVHYMKRVFKLDFGTLRNDSQRRVTQEVLQRVPISLLLTLFPLLLSFLISLPLGFLMAIYHKKRIDRQLKLFLLLLYAVPVFVVAPLLLEFVAGRFSLPGMEQPLPSKGICSNYQAYSVMTSAQRLADLCNHLFLPVLAVSYTTLASKACLVRNSVLEVLRQEYILHARARGIGSFVLYSRHVFKNALRPLLTSFSGSLGVILGGSLIVETLFSIDGFGRFFYEAILKRDTNVIMFSTIVSSVLSLVVYLAADLLYLWIDPRIHLEP